MVNARRGYTIVELLAALTALSVIMLLLFSTTGVATFAWRTSASSTDTFQQARRAFGTMSQRLGLATLNSYRDFYDPSGKKFSRVNSTTSLSYRFCSELQFICGPAASVMATGNNDPVRPTHSVFFQAPLGYQKTSNPSSRGLLNLCGYYIEYGSDAGQNPSFASPTPVKWRYRLHEAMEPSENLSIYSPINQKGIAWLTKFFTNELPSCNRVVADNVIALVILPQRYQNDTAIAPTYYYDSRAWQAGTTTLSDLTQNQLPPLLQLTLVAIDEPSAIRLQATNPGALQNLVDPSLFQDATLYADDLVKLQSGIKAVGCSYRIYQTSVALSASTWSDTGL